MSDKFHINPETGNPNKCSAKNGNCPFGGNSEHFDSKDEARSHFEHKNADQSLKSSKKVEKISSTPVEPSVANGYTERFDKDGVLTQRVRLVNNRPTDHPSGAAAVFKYSSNRIEEIHYQNGKLHDGSGEKPSKLNRIIDGPNKGSVIIYRGYRDPNTAGFYCQDSSDGQPARVVEKSDGSKVVEHYTAGRRQDPTSGEPCMIETNADGSSISRHFTDSHQHDPADGSPAVTYKRSDGSIEKTVRCHNSYVWDAANGEPAVVNYDTDGNVTSVKHAGLIISESQGRYINPVREEPLTDSIARDQISWMQPKPVARYEQ